MQAYGKELILVKHPTRVGSNAKLICFRAKSAVPAATGLGLIGLVTGRNQLEGSSSPSWSNWSKLTVLSTFDNRRLDFDLDLLRHFSNLQYVLVQVKIVLLHLRKYVGMTAWVSGLWHQRNAPANHSDDQVTTAPCGLSYHVVACNAPKICGIHSCVHCSVKTLRFLVAYPLSSLQALWILWGLICRTPGSIAFSLFTNLPVAQGVCNLAHRNGGTGTRDELAHQQCQTERDATTHVTITAQQQPDSSL